MWELLRRHHHEPLRLSAGSISSQININHASIPHKTRPSSACDKYRNEQKQPFNLPFTREEVVCTSPLPVLPIKYWPNKRHYDYNMAVSVPLLSSPKTKQFLIT